MTRVSSVNVRIICLPQCAALTVKNTARHARPGAITLPLTLMDRVPIPWIAPITMSYAMPIAESGMNIGRLKDAKCPAAVTAMGSRTNVKPMPSTVVATIRLHRTDHSAWWVAAVMERLNATTAPMSKIVSAQRLTSKTAAKNALVSRSRKPSTVRTFWPSVPVQSPNASRMTSARQVNAADNTKNASRVRVNRSTTPNVGRTASNMEAYVKRTAPGQRLPMRVLAK